jgi:hypothetical protein
MGSFEIVRQLMQSMVQMVDTNLWHDDIFGNDSVLDDKLNVTEILCELSVTFYPNYMLGSE